MKYFKENPFKRKKIHSIVLRLKRSIWTAVRGQHMIDCAWDSQDKSIFHRQSQYDGDMTSVCGGQATFRTRFLGFPVDGPLARVVPICRSLLSCPLP
ncbi:hypothetical protein TNCV_3753921 [Trichonephila clavipes]|nr:hypothetical protein TNCV_3753921 [Trichonephila clavipes]